MKTAAAEYKISITTIIADGNQLPLSELIKGALHCKSCSLNRKELEEHKNPSLYCSKGFFRGSNLMWPKPHFALLKLKWKKKNLLYDDWNVIKNKNKTLEELMCFFWPCCCFMKRKTSRRTEGRSDAGQIFNALTIILYQKRNKERKRKIQTHAWNIYSVQKQG